MRFTGPVGGGRSLRALDALKMSACGKARIVYLIAALVCFGFGTAFAWWGPDAKAVFHTTLAIWIIGAVFSGLFIRTLPSPHREIVFCFLLLLFGGLVLCLLLPVIT